MRSSFTVSVMFSSKPQFSGAFPNTIPHLAMLLSHHFLLYPPCCLREMSGFFLHEPVDGKEHGNDLGKVSKLLQNNLLCTLPRDIQQ